MSTLATTSPSASIFPTPSAPRTSTRFAVISALAVHISASPPSNLTAFTLVSCTTMTPPTPLAPRTSAASTGTSQHRIPRSLPAEYTRAATGVLSTGSATSTPMPRVCPDSAKRRSPRTASQMMIVASLAPESSSPLVLLRRYSSDLTKSVWPVKVVRGLRVAVDHEMMLLSQEPAKSVAAGGSSAREVTGAVWPRKVCSIVVSKPT